MATSLLGAAPCLLFGNLMSINRNLLSCKLGIVRRCSPESLKSLPVHHVAAIYPMLPKEKLKSMAQSMVQGGGQVHPVIIRRIGDSHEIVDGRNRIAACLLAKRPVRFTVLELSESEVFAMINSVNSQRREMNCRQQAEVAWKYIQSYKDRGERPPTQKYVAALFGISLRVMQKWKPGGRASEAHEGRVVGRRFPIPCMYRPLASKLCQLLEHGFPPKLPRESIEELQDNIEELYAKLKSPSPKPPK